MVAALACAVALLAAGCVGVIDREDFDDIVESRGGGVSNDLVLDAVAKVSERVGTGDLELTMLTITPGSRIVGLTVRDPVRRQNLDRYTYSGRDGIRDVAPVRVSEHDDLDAQSFAVSAVPALDDIETLADAALEALELTGEGHVVTISVMVVAGTLRVTVNVESDRSGGYVVFDAAGEVQEANRT